MSKKHQPPQPKEAERFVTKKSLGQNFLTSDVVPRWLAEAGDVTKEDIVIEVGPGTGVLTTELLKRGAKVYAIETDARAITVLNETFRDAITANQLQIIEADMRTYDISTLPIKAGRYKVVANIPYYLSGFLLRLFLEHTCYPKTLVFLMQKELVARIARDQKGSLLSLGVRAFGQPVYVKTVSRGHFKPSPKVDSAILQVTNISHDAFKEKADREHFFSILHLGFGQKRKQLQHNLSLHYSRDLVTQALESINLLPTIRAEDVSLADWQKLVAVLPQSTN